MQTPPTDHYSQKPSNPYSPSVPISVYRELAAELQQAREMVDSLKSQNQQLVKQNQQLQQQVEKVVQSAQHLQQIVASFGPGNDAQMPRFQSPIPPEPRVSRPQPPIPPESRMPRPQPSLSPEPRAAAASPPPPPKAANSPEDFVPPPQNPEPVPSPYGETVVIEQEDSRSRRTPSSETPGEINGWVLIIAILLVVLTAFGTGLIVVRMMFNNNSR
jgi:FtsZ-binding cell division protein ZapB